MCLLRQGDWFCVFNLFISKQSLFHHICAVDISVSKYRKLGSTPKALLLLNYEILFLLSVTY